MKECQVCALNQSNPASAPVHSWENTSHPWERLHLDFAGPFLGKMFLVVVDAHSKWVEVEIMNNVTSVGTIHKLRKMFATHGLPLFVVSDNGPAFVGEEFEMFLKKMELDTFEQRHIILHQTARLKGWSECSRNP